MQLKLEIFAPTPSWLPIHFLFSMSPTWMLQICRLTIGQSWICFNRRGRGFQKKLSKNWLKTSSVILTQLTTSISSLVEATSTVASLLQLLSVPENKLEEQTGELEQGITISTRQSAANCIIDGPFLSFSMEYEFMVFASCHILPSVFMGCDEDSHEPNRRKRFFFFLCQIL